ncbi:MAG: hypothetical protein WA667_09280 [Candidatus Nitrosopolaris sp.]
MSRRKGMKKSLPPEQTQCEEEFISNTISNVSDKHMEYLLTGAKRNTLRFNCT